MTGFGIYLVCVYIIGICANMYYIGNGGLEVGPGNLIFSTVWSVINVLGIIYLGTGLGV